MSLTSLLDQRQGPVRVFIDSCFVPDLADVRRNLPAPTRERLKTVSVVSPVQGGGLGTVGTAFDYRVRFHYEDHPVRPYAAHYGAAMLVGGCDALLKEGAVRVDAMQVDLPFECGVTGDLVGRFLAELDQVLSTLDPSGRPLSAQQEAELARRCLVLGLFEEMLRAYGTPYFDSPLFRLSDGASLDDLLALPTAEQVADVCALWSGLLEEGLPHGECVVCNPVFAGSPDAGGADADLIVDDCLIDLKTSARPNLAEMLRQLVGYVLLDYDDAYHIRRVAIYAARQRCFVELTVGELLFEYTYGDGVKARVMEESDVHTLEDRLVALRGRFRDLLLLRRRMQGAH